jgi:hypothetical protein
MRDKIRIDQHSSLGMLWVVGWLFTVGLLKFGFFKGLLALFVWPYFIGVLLAPMAAAITG